MPQNDQTFDIQFLPSSSSIFLNEIQKYLSNKYLFLSLQKPALLACRRKGSGASYPCVQIHDWRSKDRSRLSAVKPRDRMRSMMQELKYQKFYLNRKRSFFHCQSCSTLEKVAQRGCRVSILGDIRNLTGHDPEQPALIDCAFSKRNRHLPRSFLNSIVLCQFTYNEVITVN